MSSALASHSGSRTGAVHSGVELDVAVIDGVTVTVTVPTHDATSSNVSLLTCSPNAFDYSLSIFFKRSFRPLCIFLFCFSLYNCIPPISLSPEKTVIKKALSSTYIAQKQAAINPDKSVRPNSNQVPCCICYFLYLYGIPKKKNPSRYEMNVKMKRNRLSRFDESAKK